MCNHAWNSPPATLPQDAVDEATADSGRVGRGRRLGFLERVAIADGLTRHQSTAAIARSLHRHRSVIAREIARGSVHGTYIAVVAHQQAASRRLRPKPRKLDTYPALRAVVVGWLNDRYSPQQISGRLRRAHGNDRSMQISHESIYQSLYVQGYRGLRHELAVEKALRRGGTAHKPASRLPSRGRRPWLYGAKITDRPAVAADRAIPGHWEGDLIIGTDQATALITLVERRSRYLLLHRLGNDHTAATVAEALVGMVGGLPGDLMRTLTWDQGVEMAQVATFEIASEVDVFFCDPHSPWQRPTNENANGLVREFFPKDTDFSQVTDEQVRHAQDLLNRRPRKALDFATPSEILMEALNGAITP